MRRDIVVAMVTFLLVTASSAHALPRRGRRRRAPPQTKARRLTKTRTTTQRAIKQLGRREAFGHVMRIGALALPVAEYVATGHISGASLITTLGTFWLGGHLVKSAGRQRKALRKQQAHREARRSWDRITSSKATR